jgi:hypothetical protein
MNKAGQINSSGSVGGSFVARVACSVAGGDVEFGRGRGAPSGDQQKQACGGFHLALHNGTERALFDSAGAGPVSPCAAQDSKAAKLPKPSPGSPHTGFIRSSFTRRRLVHVMRSISATCGLSARHGVQNRDFRRSNAAVGAFVGRCRP